MQMQILEIFIFIVLLLFYCMNIFFSKGLEEVAKEQDFKEDHVALVTFGHDTRVIQKFSNDMNKIRKALGKRLEIKYASFSSYLL